MKKLFYLNRRWSKAAGFFLFSMVACFLLMSLLSAKSLSLPHSYLWSIGILLGLGLLIAVLVITVQTQVKEVEIEKDYFILHFFLFNQKMYRFNQLKQYATAAFGGNRYIMAHSVILEFDDGKCYQVADPIIDNYKQFYEFMLEGDFDYFGYIGQNNWRKRNRPLSKKWVIDRNEKDLIKSIEKKKGVIILYIYGIIALAMNYAMVCYLIF